MPRSKESLEMSVWLLLPFSFSSSPLSLSFFLLFFSFSSVPFAPRILSPPFPPPPLAGQRCHCHGVSTSRAGRQVLQEGSSLGLGPMAAEAGVTAKVRALTDQLLVREVPPSWRRRPVSAAFPYLQPLSGNSFILQNSVPSCQCTIWPQLIPPNR